MLLELRCLAALSCLLACACAAGGSRIRLPAGDLRPAQVQFSAQVQTNGRIVPLQGGMEMERNGGVMAVILPYGQTLGQCAYSADMNMHCQAAPGAGDTGASLLPWVGLALYRLLPLIDGADGAPSHGQDWSAACPQGGNSCTYANRGKEMRILFMGDPAP